jgi:ORF6N domain
VSGKAIVPLRIEGRIRVVRGVKIIIDADLAELYGVETRTLNQAVKRHPERFPADFMFQLSTKEFADWRSQVVMSNPGAKMGLRRAPFAFTEHGALMAATVLNSPRAVEMSLYVVRAFAQLREVLATHKDLAAKLATLERQTQALALKHDALAQNTRLQLKQVFEAIRELMAPPEPPKRPIGFVTPQENKAGRKNRAR